LAYRSSNLALFRRIVKDVRKNVRVAELLPATTTISAMAGAHSRSVHQVTKFRGSLDIGASIHIPCWSYSHTQEQRMPTFKKTSVAAACRVIEMQAKLDQGLMSHKDFQEALKDPRSAGIVRDFSRKRVQSSSAAAAAAGRDGGGGGGGGGGGSVYMDDQQDWTIPPESLIKAYRYGKDIVPVSNADMQSLMVLKTDKSLSVLAIIDAASVPRYAYFGTADILVPSQTEGETKSSTLALSGFARALSKEGKVALCRYVKRSNGAPSLVLAIPGLARGNSHPLSALSDELNNEDMMTRQEVRPSASVLVGDHRASVVPLTGGQRKSHSSSTTSSASSSASSTVGKKRPRTEEEEIEEEQGGRVEKDVATTPQVLQRNVRLVSQQPLRTYEFAGPAYRPPPLSSTLPFDVLYLVPVPFDDDVRLYPFPRLFSTLDKYKPSVTQLQVMDDYIDGMDLTVAEPAGYDPTQAFNPMLRRHYQTLMVRMLDPNAPIAEIDKDVEASMRPIYERMPSYKPAKLGCAGLASGNFNLTVRAGSDILGSQRVLDPRLQIAMKKAAEKGGFALDVISTTHQIAQQSAQTLRTSSSSSSSSSTMAGGGVDQGFDVGDSEMKQGEESNLSLQAPLSTPLPPTSVSSTSSSSSSSFSNSAVAFRSVGTTHPVNDFLALLSTRTETSIVRAFATLAHAILLLATDSVRVETAIEALKSFRAQSFLYVEEVSYNILLKKLKSDHFNARLKKGTVFWLALEKEGDSLTLISRDEAGGVNDITPEMARNFIKSENLIDQPRQQFLEPAHVEDKDDEDALDIE
jgi:hypothetical protein